MPPNDRISSPRRPSPPTTSAEDRATEVLFLILVLAAIFGAAANFFQSRQFRAYFVKIFPPTSLSYYDTANGARVYVSAGEGNVREVPGGIRIGGQESGAAGTVAGGPERAAGTRFWNIKFDSGPGGWVAEDELQLFKPETFLSRLGATLLRFIKIISTLLSLLFLSGTVYAVVRISQIVSEQRSREVLKETPAYSASAAVEYVNRRWERAVAHVQSDSPADWRLAVLEADIMLAEMLDRMGYVGENVGEKLKRIEQSDFNTIEDAWEAHKVRNLLAHQGSDYILSKREAQRVIGLYANVFREFRYI